MTDILSGCTVRAAIQNDPLTSNERPQGPLWIPTAQVERMMRECRASEFDTVGVDRKTLEGLLHDSLLWRQKRAAQQRGSHETSECSYESEDGDTLTYETSCGNVFRLDPMLELYEFCPYCGKRVTQKSNAVRDSIAPNKQCPKCKGFFWLDKFDDHDCRPLKASERLPPGTKVRLTGPLFPGSPRTGWVIENVDEPRELKYRVRHPSGSLCDVLAECVVVDEAPPSNGNPQA